MAPQQGSGPREGVYPSPTHCRSRAGETGRGHGVHAGWATSEVKSGGHGACTETLWVVSALSSHAHQFPGAFMGRWGGDDGDGYDVSLASNVKALQLFLLFPWGQISTPPARIYEVAHLHVSIQGGSLQVSEQKTVLVKALELGTLVQTDKDVYKPGQTVKFRIVRLDLNFIPSNREDPSGNRIAQWREVSPRQGIVDLSLPLAAEPALGTYIIEVEGKSHSFSVEEYVLPKFEVTIDLPAVVLEKDKKFQVEICGRYTYGKPVQGKVQASMCHTFRYIGILYTLNSALQRENCIEVSGQVSTVGEWMPLGQSLPGTAANGVESLLPD
uniref:Alpha-2-macroglobulin-like n=1 Tax=Accipiter nisus TaxID=211598 RepID=A0A8B9RT73_9AVES